MGDSEKTQRFKGLEDALKRSIDTPPIQDIPSEQPDRRDPDWPVEKK